jgi:hypothetical protein
MPASRSTTTKTPRIDGKTKQKKKKKKKTEKEQTAVSTFGGEALGARA